MLNAFQAEVPAISSPAHVFDETVGGAFLPAVPLTDELSRQLINLYRDERLRETLVEKGREVLKNFSWKRTVEIWYQCIEEVTK
jgi:glycosyltransferase involved in cell wall biosynthesis